ncbi:MAG: XrtA system polysaccharide deacetylase [Planctomycetota bacterium]
MAVTNALTFDIEEYFHAHNLEGVVSRGDWEGLPGRAAEHTRLILRLLREHGVRATFFVLGWVAERHPDVVREIVGEGHEVGSHGHEHRPLCRQRPGEFLRDLDRSCEAIRSALVGSDAPRCLLHGYRAPSFSITRETTWALDLLRQRGFRYDSSIFPISFHDRYGFPGAERHAHRIQEELWEFPISTLRILGKNWPVAGGGYLRLMPYGWTRWAIRRINLRGEPAVIYLHPWEFDPKQPVVRGLPALARFRHYVNLARTESRLRRLLRDFRFAPLSEVYARELGGTVCG